MSPLSSPVIALPLGEVGVATPLSYTLGYSGTHTTDLNKLHVFICSVRMMLGSMYCKINFIRGTKLILGPFPKREVK